MSNCSLSFRREPKTRALLAFCDAIVDIVQAGGDQGMPGGTLYAALMTYGVTLEQFESIMRALVDTKQVEKRGQLYFGRGK